MKGVLIFPGRRIDQHPTDGFREHISSVFVNFRHIGAISFSA
jgi:hypothetical protein